MEQSNVCLTKMEPPDLGRGRCAECGAALPVGRLANRCPNCLFGLAMELEGTGPSTDDEAEQPWVGQGRPRTDGSRVGQVGEYELVEELGRGGMGAVYRARHRTLNRWVALKRIRLERWDNPDSVMRFQIESEAIARLDHPGIVPLHDAGECDGQHYFTMKLVEGGSLSERLAAAAGAGEGSGHGSAEGNGTDGPGPTRAWVRGWVECLAKICDAVHYAHQHGVIHRDLKPANILLDTRGEPMVTDFGLAKILENDAGITQTRSVLGSPNYMAPEQASGDGSRISTGVDIYSLGAILYEVLAGEPPFKSATVLETIRRVVESPPRGPRSFNPSVDADLETVCLKCLEKDPKARYLSAAELAEELRRWLAGLPVRSRPANQAELIWRWCKRNPALAGALGAVLALVVTVAVGATIAAIHIRTAQQETKQVVMQMRIEKAERLLETTPAKGLALLAQVVSHHPENQDAAVRLASALSYRSHAVPVFEPLSHESRLIAAKPSATGDAMATVTARGMMRIWEIPSGRLLQQTNCPGVVGGAFATDAARLVLATGNGRFEVWETEPELARVRFFQDEDAASARKIWLDPQGAILGSVTRVDHTVRFWRLETGQVEFEIDEEAPITAGKISPDARWVGLGRSDGAVNLWEMERRERRPWEMRHAGYVNGLAFSRDGRYLASCSSDQTARIWDLTDGGKLVLQIDHKHEVTGVEFSADGRLVVTASLDRSAQVWDVEAGRPLVDPVAHSEGLTAVHLWPGNDYLASTSYPSLCWLWRLRPALLGPLELPAAGKVATVDVSPDGRWLVAGSCVGTAHLWDTRSGRAHDLPGVHGGHINSVKFSADGRRLVTASFDNTVQVRDLDSGQVRVLEHENWVRTARFDPSGRRVVTAAHDRSARIWDLDTGELIRLRHEHDVEDATFSHDGRQVGTASKDATACLWDAATGRLLARLKHRSWVSSIQFRHDDQRVVTASFDKTACVWRLDPNFADEPAPGVVLRHDGEVAHAAFSPDGARIVTASYDRTARVWQADTGQPEPYVLVHDDPVVFAAFSADSRRVVTASRDGSARVWSVDTGQPLTEPLRHGGIVNCARFSPDGGSVITGSQDGKARIWPLATLEPSEGPWLADLGQYLSRMAVDSHDQFVPLSAAQLDRLGRGLRSGQGRPAMVRAILGGNESPGEQPVSRLGTGRH